MTNRLVNYDLLRILAAYLIVMLHLSVQYINLAPASYEAYTQWEYAIVFSTISRVGVPIFIMLSGLFLLNPEKDITISMVFTKYLPKVILIFIIWSFFYAFAEQDFFRLFSESATSASVTGSGFSSLHARFNLCWDAMNQEYFWHSVVKGHYHMWYLYMLAGLYLITPVLRVITAHATKQQFIYFSALCILITFITKFNDTLWRIKLLSEALDTLALTFVFGYIGYFLAGYFLDKHFAPSKTSENPIRSNHLTLKGLAFNYIKRIFNGLNKPAVFIYILGIASFIFTVTWTIKENPMFGFKKPELILFSNYSPTIFLISFAVFTFATSFKNIRFPRFFRIIAAKLPKYMLVVYMVHPFIIKKAKEAALLHPVDFAWSLPLNSLIVFLISLSVSILLMQAYFLAIRIIRW